MGRYFIIRSREKFRRQVFIIMRCSLIISAYNAEDTISTCLDSAQKQSLSKEKYEVIVVDDGSTDRTKELIKKHSLKLIEQKNYGPAFARNRGAKEARGDIVVFTDSDCYLSQDFLKRITAPIANDLGVVGVQGSYKTKQKEFMARFGQIEIETRYKRMAKQDYIDFIGTYAAAYRKDIFWKYGGFDTGFPMASGEDIEFSHRLHKNGYKMVFEPEAFVYHQHPYKLKKYIESKFYRGFWRIRLYEKHPKKAIKDSYTPQSLKFQVLAGVPLFIVFGFLSFFKSLWIIPFLLIMGSFFLFSFPFFRLFKKKRYSGGIYIPFVIFIRAASLLIGMIAGCVNEIKNRFINNKK